MKQLIISNWIAVGIPVLLAFFGFIVPETWILALLSTILTGFIQLVISIVLFSRNKSGTFLTVYYAGVALFFALCAFFPLIWLLPPLLAFYMTWMLHYFGSQERLIQPDTEKFLAARENVADHRKSSAGSE